MRNIIFPFILLFFSSCGENSNGNKPGENSSMSITEATEEFDLISKYDCATCHRKDEKITGPSYMDIAAKYKSDKKAEGYLSRKILEGGSGVWGNNPMNAHPSMPKEDAVLLARYILSL